MSDGGKGSAPRPIEVPKEEYDRRWEETFGKKQPKVTSGWRKRGGGRK
jgi:hypothetical protein